MSRFALPTWAYRDKRSVMEMKEQESVEFIQRFLRTMEARDLDKAEAVMAPGARITFPGGEVYASQTEMIQANRGRYQWVKKTFDQADVLERDGSVVVYIMGTLYGVNRYGIPFADIRYIDRFVIRDGAIISQEVWNDLAESGVLDQRT